MHRSIAYVSRHANGDAGTESKRRADEAQGAIFRERTPQAVARDWSQDGGWAKGTTREEHGTHEEEENEDTHDGHGARF